MEDFFKEWVVSRVPQKFWMYLEEETFSAFARAHLLSKTQFEPPEYAAMLAQTRHACCEEAFRHSAENSGLKVTSLETNPMGGRYSLCMADGLYLLRSNIQPHSGTPDKPTKFRSENAALNAWLGPRQLDLLEPDQQSLPAGQACGLIVTTSPRQGQDQSLPAFIGLGVPDKDLKQWLFLRSVDQLVSMYHDMSPKTQEPSVTIKDQALPRLKDKKPE